MKLVSLNVRKGMFEKIFQFSTNINLVFSEANSVGKTTLLRMLIFSLGYSIPSTKGLDLNKYEFVLKIITDSNKELDLFRFHDYYSISYNKIEEVFSLPIDLYDAQSKIFEISNKVILSNLLGTFYIDQEKGWTLLNRGKAIGNNHFNIESFIQGLSNRDCSELYVRQGEIKRQIQKYKHMFNIAQYQKELNDLNENIAYDAETENIQKELDLLAFERKPLENEENRLKKVLKKNSTFIKYIEDMKLFVQAPDKSNVPVNQQTLVGFVDSNEYIISKRKLINEQIVNIDRKINTLKSRLESEQTLVQMETLIQNFDSNISKINIDVRAVENVLIGLEKERKKIATQIADSTKSNNLIIVELHEMISTYCKEFGVDEIYVTSKQDYIFTSDLKSLSGAIFHKIVFAFKLAYIKSVEKYTGISLPIILDSPSGREIEKINVDDMMRVLERDFYNHQIIIASIHKYDFSLFNTIEIKDKLLGF